jgi:hypothetical protein
LKNQLNGTAVIDFDTDVIKVMLTTVAYVPNIANHVYAISVTSEVVGTNYTTGGSQLTAPTLQENLGVVTFDANDVDWLVSLSGFTDARFAVLYKDTGLPSSSPLIGYIDLGSNVGNTITTLSLRWAASGILAWA